MDDATVRAYVKLLAAHAGIKKDIKYHTSRHSFAMRMSEKGFDLEEIAEFIGDSVDVTKIYRPITNKRLAEKVRRVMK